MSEWLIRTAENLIAGPYTSQQVREFIAEEKINRHDEICQSNHYWIYLHEGEELWDQLQIRLPHGMSDDELTQTEDVSIPDLELESDHENIEERTLLLRNRQLRQFQQPTKQRRSTIQPRPTVEFQQSSVWTHQIWRRVVVGLLIAFFALASILLSRFFLT